MSTQTRQLSAIMFTDIVGYTAMMQTDEQKGMELVERHRIILQEEVDRYAGDIVQFYGDGSLILFPSALAAVQCAIGLQQASQAELYIPIRIGIHSGEIIKKDEHVFGDAINIAARIQSEAVEGGICISERIYNYIQNHSEIRVLDLGPKKLKNVKNPIRIYQIETESSQKARSLYSGLSWNKQVKRTLNVLLIAAVLISAVYIIGQKYTSQSDPAPEKSIVVLPFDHLSDMTDYEYFTEGIMEDILNQLGNMNELRVISRTTARQYKDTEKSVPEIAVELDVSYVLEGSVRKHGDSIRVVAQLINGLTDAHLISNSYDRKMDDVIRLQNEIAIDIAGHLKATLLPEEQERMNQRLSINPQAYDLYLKGNYAILEYTKEQNEQAIAYYQKSIALDSGYADAWAGLASAYVGRFSRYGMDYAWVDSAQHVIEHALSLNSESSHIYAAAAVVFSKLGKLDLARKANEEALRFNPNNAMAMGNLGLNYKSLGQMAEAMTWFKKSDTRDPLAYSAKINIGVTYSYFGQPDLAEMWFQKALAIQPNSKQVLHALAHMHLAYGQDAQALVLKDSMERFIEESWMVLEWMADISRLTGNPAEAEVYYRKAYAINPNIQKDWYAYSPIGLGHIMLQKGLEDAGYEFLNMALNNRLAEIDKDLKDPWTFQEVAAIYAIIGKEEEALIWLEKAINTGWKDYRFAQRDPWFENLHDNSRFRELLDQVASSLAEMNEQFEAMN